MGPAADDITDMSSTSTSIQIASLPKLLSDGSNWPTYQECVLNTLTSKGLKRHVLGTAHKPEVPVEHNGSFYYQNSMNPLTDEELEKNEDEQDSYDQKQAAIQEIIYWTIDMSSFLQVKNKKTATDVWKKLILIHTEKGGMYETNLLTKLQNMRLAEGDNICTHLTAMMEIKECLAEIGSPILPS